MRRLTKLFYSGQECKTIQQAHLRASKQLRRSPTTHENAERLARRIMSLFDQGMRDADAIASVTISQAQLIARVIDACQGARS